MLKLLRFSNFKIDAANFQLLALKQWEDRWDSDNPQRDKKDSDILIINCTLILSYFGEAENNMNYFIWRC